MRYWALAVCFDFFGLLRLVWMIAKDLVIPYCIVPFTGAATQRCCFPGDMSPRCVVRLTFIKGSE